MSHIKFASFTIVIAATFALVGCGGAIGSFEGIDPRVTVISDLQSKSFRFDWFPVGNPIKDSLGSFSLEFGVFDSQNAAPFTIVEDDGGSATGSAQLMGDNLQFTIQAVATGSVFAAGETRLLKIESDQNDGRIRFTDQVTGREVTSSPQ
ncbi:MAG: hypothetical protein JNM28_09800 [Armatimonadetes bacterium]|nr:hypothetical protein [Armatimonadota bacterium]